MRVFESLERIPETDVPSGMNLRMRSDGPPRMSAVLLEFIEPYRQRGLMETDLGLRSLIAMGQVAWNTALVPAEKRDEIMRQMIDRGVTEGAADARQTINALIERKQKWFSHIQRVILDFELRMTEGRPHLSVVSTVVSKA